MYPEAALRAVNALCAEHGIYHIVIAHVLLEGASERGDLIACGRLTHVARKGFRSCGEYKSSSTTQAIAPVSGLGLNSVLSIFRWRARSFGRVEGQKRINLCLNLCVGLVNERAKVPKLIIGRVPALLLVPFVAGIAAGVPADGVLGRVAWPTVGVSPRATSFW